MQEVRSNALARRLLRGFGWILVGLWWLWGVLALWFAPWPWLARFVIAVVALTVLTAVWRSRWRSAAAVGCALALSLAWCLLVRPQVERADWAPDQARMPEVTIAGERMTVRNVRNCEYCSASDFDVRWDQRSYDLARLATVWFVVEPFSINSAGAHTFLSFGFDDGSYVAISAEVRKQVGEHFSPLAAAFRSYELMYVVADERDVIRLRANYRHDEVYVYPMRATREQARRLLIGMLTRADALRCHPEFYHILTNTCTTNIVAQVNAIWPGTVPLRREILLPGHADRLAYDLGLIDSPLPFAECRAHHRINARALAADHDADFSRRIRE